MPITYKNVNPNYGAANSLFRTGVSTLGTVGSGINSLYDKQKQLALEEEKRMQEQNAAKLIGALSGAKNAQEAGQIMQGLGSMPVGDATSLASVYQGRMTNFRDAKNDAITNKKTQAEILGLNKENSWIDKKYGADIGKVNANTNKIKAETLQVPKLADSLISYREGTLKNDSERNRITEDHYKNQDSLNKKRYDFGVRKYNAAIQQKMANAINAANKVGVPSNTFADLTRQYYAGEIGEKEFRVGALGLAGKSTDLKNYNKVVDDVIQSKNNKQTQPLNNSSINLLKEMSKSKGVYSNELGSKGVLTAGKVFQAYNLGGRGSLNVLGKKGSMLQVPAEYRPYIAKQAIPLIQEGYSFPEIKKKLDIIMKNVAEKAGTRGINRHKIPKEENFNTAKQLAGMLRPQQPAVQQSQQPITPTNLSIFENPPKKRGPTIFGGRSNR